MSPPSGSLKAPHGSVSVWLEGSSGSLMIMRAVIGIGLPPPSSSAVPRTSVWTFVGPEVCTDPLLMLKLEQLCAEVSAGNSVTWMSCTWPPASML